MKRYYSTYERAYYDSIGHYINLNSYDQKKFHQIFRTKITEQTIEDWKIYYHELRHWVDSISSNYGQEYLFTSFEMLCSKLRSKDYYLNPINPMVIHELIEKNELINIPIKETISKYEPSKMWRIDKEFMHFEGIFLYILKLLNNENAIVCKTPITYLSLFETNAIYEELHLYCHFSQYMNRKKSHKEICDIIEYEKHSKRVYNSELIDYSAVSHLVSGYFEIPAILDAYNVASQISSILLNLTKEHLIKLGRNLMHRHRHHQFFFMNRDFGYILHCICIDYLHIQKYNHIFDAEQFLDFFSLPNLKKAEQDVIDEMIQRTERFNKKSYFYDKYKKLALDGINLFDKMGLNSRKMTMMTYLNKNTSNVKPYLIYGDEIWNETPLNQIIKKDILKLTKQEWHDLVSKLRIPDDEITKFVI